MSIITNSLNQFSTTPYIVDHSAANGAYTTITAAVAAANAAGGGEIFIRSGTYTESFTLPANILLTGYDSAPSLFGTATGVVIDGTITISDAGIHEISNVALDSSSAAIPSINVTGVANSVLVINNCKMANPATDILTGSNSNCQVLIQNSYFFGLGGNYANLTGAKTFFQNCNFVSLSGTTPTLTSNGSHIGLFNCNGDVTLICSGATQGSISSCNFSTQTSSNLILSGTAQISIYNTFLENNSASTGIVVGVGTNFTAYNSQFASQAVVGISNAGGNVQLNQCAVQSSSLTFAISGTGNLAYDFLALSGSNSSIDPGITVTVLAGKPLATVSGAGFHPGLAYFNASDFTVDSTGQVSIIGGAAISTINGDTGSITGSTVTIYADHAANTCGGSVLFSNSGTTSTLNVTDALENTFFGISAGNSSVLGGNNNSFGKSSLEVIGSGSLNAAFGESSLGAATTGSFNSAYGNLTLSSLIGGSYNCAIGYQAGSAYTGSEDDNILIMNSGVLGESNTLRIGTQGSGSGQVNRAFMAGVYGVSPTSPQMATINSSGQLGSQAIPSTMAWQTVTASVANVAKFNGYIAIAAGGALTFGLPTFGSSTIGDVFTVVLNGATSWQITQGANQQIRIANSTTTAGVGGSLTSTAEGDLVEILYQSNIGGTEQFIVTKFIGNITVV